jgi:hypothetical protein
MKRKLTVLMFLITAGLFAKHIAKNPGGWILYSANGEIPLTNLSGGGVSFPFPVSSLPDPNANGDWAEYLLESHTTRLPKGGFLTMTLTMETMAPAPIFNWMSESYNTCGGHPAAIRLYFQSGQLWSGAGYNRWWSNASDGVSISKYVLAAGTVTLTIPLTPDRWSETFGHYGDSSATATNGFNNTLARPTYWGATMGGGCFFGHGVNVTGGTAHFALTNYSEF